MKAHISSVCSAVHGHLRNIGSFRQYLTQGSSTPLAHCLITAMLDHDNALLHGVHMQGSGNPPPKDARLCGPHCYKDLYNC